MKTIIAGSRTITGPMSFLNKAMAGLPFTPTGIISGGASGVDKMGERWAKANKVQVVRFPANWKEHGRAAGPIRNAEMASYADALVAIWDGHSKGTKHMIRAMEKLGKPVYKFLCP